MGSGPPFLRCSKGGRLTGQPVQLLCCVRGSAQTEPLSRNAKPLLCCHLYLWAENLSSLQACQVPASPHPCLLCPQCLNAVRTVQSLACLEEADHTVGFILQLSSFMKEWHFHLPQLMRDVQVGPQTWCLGGVWGSAWGQHTGCSRAPPVNCSPPLERGLFARSTAFGFTLLPLELNVPSSA